MVKLILSCDGRGNNRIHCSDHGSSISFRVSEIDGLHYGRMNKLLKYEDRVYLVNALLGRRHEISLLRLFPE